MLERFTRSKATQEQLKKSQVFDFNFAIKVDLQEEKQIVKR